MTFDRFLGVASVFIGAVAVSDKVTDLVKQERARRAERERLAAEADERFLNEEEARFQREWADVRKDFR